MLLVIHAITGLVGVVIRIKHSSEPWAGPVFGFVNGVFIGMTGSFVVPGVMYLQAIGLHRDALVQAMGLLFLVSTVALVLALQGRGLLGAELGALFALGVVPAFAGIWFGLRLRRWFSEALFRRVFLNCLPALGA